MIIDSHHHFWNYHPTEFDWIDDSMRAIRRNFLPGDLESTIAPLAIEGVVSVQARQSLEETRWLLELAASHEFIRGVVGWVDLRSDAVSEQLHEFSANPKLKAVRHVVQGEPDDQFILGTEFNRGIVQLKEFGLTYDILILERHLPATIEFVDRHPDQTFVLDHIAKPKISENTLEPWKAYLTELARRPNVYCKVSGMVTEAQFDHWTMEQLRPYWDCVLKAFGPARLMYGSDWPVCLVACQYDRWFQTVQDFASYLSETERQAIFGQNAARAYNLTD